MSTSVHALRGFRASLLRFAADSAQAVFDQDGLLVVGPGATGTQQVLAAGPYADVAPRYPGLAVEHLPGRIIAPGFVDMHIHYPQTDVIGAPAEGLLALTYDGLAVARGLIKLPGIGTPEPGAL